MQWVLTLLINQAHFGYFIPAQPGEWLSGYASPAGPVTNGINIRYDYGYSCRLQSGKSAQLWFFNLRNDMFSSFPKLVMLLTLSESPWTNAWQMNWLLLKMLSILSGCTYCPWDNLKIGFFLSMIWRAPVWSHWPMSPVCSQPWSSMTCLEMKNKTGSF